jgi:O-antigen/teichoic acid export membrane protein
MSESTLKEKTSKGLFWGGFGNIFQQIVGAGFGIAIARILSPDDYGLVGILAIFPAIATNIIDSGFTIALANRKEIRHEDYNAVFWFNLFAGIVAYIVLFAAAPLIAHYFKKPVLTDLSRLYFLGLTISSMGIAHHAIMFKKLMVKERIKIDIVAVCVSGTVGLILALNGFAYWGIAIQSISMGLVGVVLRWYFSNWRPTCRFDFTPLKEMFGFSAKLLLTNLSYIISNNFLNLILGKLYTETEVGYYSQSAKWVVYGSSIIQGMISSVAQPVFAEVNQDKSRQLNIFRKMLRLGAFTSFPILLGLAFIGKEFILIALGEKWAGCVPVLQLLCIWGAFGYLWLLYVTLILSYNKSNVYLYGNLSIFIVQLICVALMSRFGILPMVGIYVLCYLAGLFLWHYFVNKLIGLRFKNLLTDTMPYLAITLGCFVVAWVLTRQIENIYLLCIAKVAIVAILYLLIAKFSGSVIFKESIMFLTNRIKRKDS